MICQECKAEIHGEPKFCPKCGAKVDAVRLAAPGTKVCPQCGAENSLTAKFCKSDGYRFPDAAETAPAVQAIQPVAPPPSSRPAPPTAPAPSAAPVEKDLSSGAPASAPDIPESSRTPHPGVAKERVESTGDERPVPVARGPGVEGAVPHRDSTEAPQPAVAARAEPRRIAATAPPEPRPNLDPKPEKSRKPLLLAVAALLVVGLSAAGGAYWLGYIGNRQASVQEKINAELGGKGLSSVKVIVARDWKTTAEGMVGSPAEKQQALALVRGHGELKEITDSIRVKPTREELAQRLTKALADAGMSQVTAQLDEGLTTVTLNDPTLGPEDRAKAEACRVRGNSCGGHCIDQGGACRRRATAATGGTASFRGACTAPGDRRSSRSEGRERPVTQGRAGRHIGPCRCGGQCHASGNGAGGEGQGPGHPPGLGAAGRHGRQRLDSCSGALPRHLHPRRPLRRRRKHRPRRSPLGPIRSSSKARSIARCEAGVPVA